MATTKPFPTSATQLQVIKSEDMIDDFLKISLAAFITAGTAASILIYLIDGWWGVAVQWALIAGFVVLFLSFLLSFKIILWLLDKIL